MQLHRFAVIGLSTPSPLRVLMLRYRSTVGPEVTIDSLDGVEASYEASDLAASSGLRIQWPSPDNKPALVRVQSVVTGLTAEFDESGRLLVPGEARQRAEAAIEEFADLLAVAHQCRRTIRSPQTSVALAPESDGEFGDATVLAFGKTAGPSASRILPELCADKLPDAIWGRTEGLRLLASGLSEESPGGRAREFYRLIEAAFGDGIGRLTIPLYEFLKTAPYSMDFSKKETNKWVAMRGKIMHGDIYIASNSDVIPFLGRLEWAAYDLLLHKQNWGTKDVARRSGVPMLSGPNHLGSIVAFHPGASVQVEFMDSFGVYPVDRVTNVTVGGSGVITDLPMSVDEIT